MRNIKEIYLMGFTVQGLDRRDGSSFEDFYVIETTKSGKPIERNTALERIEFEYGKKGYDVTNIIPDRPEPIKVELKLFEVWRAKAKE